jgi:serpin B
MRAGILAVLILAAASAPWAQEAVRGPGAGALAQGNNEFALALYGRLASEARGNVFCSPYSIASALAMTYAGARGETAGQMARALRFSQTGERLHAAFGELSASLNAEGRGGDVQLSAANALWGQSGFPFKKRFLALIRRHYGAGLHEMDFRADAEGSRRAINSWVENETRQKINDLIAPGVLNDLTRLVLTNAIYFKGNWKAQFKKAATKDEPFHLEDGGEVRAPLMNQTGEFGYMETPEFQGLELPYAGEKLAMVVLLPRKAGGIRALEKRLAGKNLADWLSRLNREEVHAALPRFKTTSQFELSSALRSMGMSAAFTQPSAKPGPGEADFSGMDGKRDLYIWAAIHKAFVNVNEEGTEAAAATAIVMAPGSALGAAVPVFRADHPFLFLIRDRDSGIILFLGRLAKPG